jgi:hypothetical protein
MYLKEHPWTDGRRKSRGEYEQNWLKQGYVAVNSILRDTIKSLITAIECGAALSFETMFLPWTLTPDGRTVSEWVEEMGFLPSPESPKAIVARA